MNVPGGNQQTECDEAGSTRDIHPNIDVSKWIHRWANCDPEKTAVIFNAMAVSYADLEDRIRGVSSRLRSLGVKPGDRVAVCATNRIEILELFFSCARLGAILVPINNRLTAPEVRFQIEDCEPVVVLTDAPRSVLIVEAGAVPTDLDDFASMAHSTERQDAASIPEVPEDLERPLLLVYTSGTTGTPKGAVLSQRSLLYTVLNAIDHEGFDSDSIVASVLPLFHVGGLNIQTIPCLYAGGTVVLAERFVPESLLKMIRSHRPTHMLLVPTAMSALLDAPTLAPQDLSSLGALNCGSSVVPEKLIRRFNSLGVRVVQVYGATETGPTAVVLRYADAGRVGSCGKPARHSELRIVDDVGTDVSPGETGELWLRGPHLFTHYWNRPEDTEQAFSGSWYATGDLGFADEEGFIFITGRRRDLIISGGENIYPAEVESVVGEHPSVAEVAIVGRPDPHWGEVPLAFVVPRDRAPIDEALLNNWCADRLARYKMPRQWIFMEHLPRTSLGKVKKYMLPLDMAACVSNC